MSPARGRAATSGGVRGRVGGLVGALGSGLGGGGSEVYDGEDFDTNSVLDSLQHGADSVGAGSGTGSGSGGVDGGAGSVLRSMSEKVSSSPSFVPGGRGPAGATVGLTGHMSQVRRGGGLTRGMAARVVVVVA